MTAALTLLPDTELVLGSQSWLAPVASPGAQRVAAQLPPPRRNPFLSGRTAAEQALRALGVADVEVLRGESGAPIWPEGLAGSIAHDADHAIALAGWQRHWLALGVDLEPDLPLAEDAATIVLSADERTAVAAPGEPLRHGRLVFGAKECVHKALHPLRGAWLEFDEVAVSLSDPSRDEGEWTPQPLSDAARSAFEGLLFLGRWRRHGGKLISALGVRAAPSSELSRTSP